MLSADSRVDADYLQLSVVSKRAGALPNQASFPRLKQMDIKTLTLQTESLKKVTEFYRDILGAPILAETTYSVTFAFGVTTLTFQEREVSDHPPRYHFAFNIPSNRIEEAEDWMTSKALLQYFTQYDSHIAEFTNWNARSIFFFDPAGNIVEFIARRDINVIATELFSSGQILSMTEIGIVFPRNDFKARVANLMESYQLSYYTKQEPHDEFVALDDEHGLCIIVAEKRVWFGTEDMEAEAFPVRVEIESNGMNRSSTIG